MLLLLNIQYFVLHLKFIAPLTSLLNIFVALFTLILLNRVIVITSLFNFGAIFKSKFSYSLTNSLKCENFTICDDNWWALANFSGNTISLLLMIAALRFFRRCGPSAKKNNLRLQSIGWGTELRINEYLWTPMLEKALHIAWLILPVRHNAMHTQSYIFSFFDDFLNNKFQTCTIISIRRIFVCYNLFPSIKYTKEGIPNHALLELFLLQKIFKKYFFILNK